MRHANRRSTSLPGRFGQQADAVGTDKRLPEDRTWNGHNCMGYWAFAREGSADFTPFAKVSLAHFE